jgi:uncharacterized membrane protein YfcA
MTFSDILLLAGAGALSGALNAVAGGGTFFTFAALLAVGLPPITANASSALALTVGSLASAAAYRQEIGRMWRATALLATASAIGGVLGAGLLVALDNVTFQGLIPWLLLAATVIFALGPAIARRIGSETHENPTPARRAAGFVLQLLTSIYGGFFGAGMGFLMLASLGLTEGQDYHRLNAIKQVLGAVIQGVAIVVFIGGNVIAWSPALIVMLAAIAGGYFGVELARKVPAGIMRVLVIATGAVLTGYYFLAG